ncbi:MAG: hypothetical protein EOP50_01340 [Sphingobacteriales bacterium]|nr:MAG: hypothetical protein EOP50_01340 [Sphingobacteriales bacterium]
MAFIETYRFRARLPKADLLHFVAMAPSGQYVFLAPPGPDLYGLFASDDVLEFFCNECRVEEFQVLEAAEWAQVRRRSDCKIWGDASLLDL